MEGDLLYEIMTRPICVSQRPIIPALNIVHMDEAMSTGL